MHDRARTTRRGDQATAAAPVHPVAQGVIRPLDRDGTNRPGRRDRRRRCGRVDGLSRARLRRAAGGPAEQEDGAEDADDEVRFALTSEAGLNDGLSFPFTNPAIAMAAGGSWVAGWVIDDVLVELTIGVVAGFVLGKVIAFLSFGVSHRIALARTGQGFVSLGATLVVYGVTELVHGYEFLAVFVAAMAMRRTEADHEYHEALHDFSEALERLASTAFLLLLGGAAVDGALGALTALGAAVAAVVVLVVGPLSGWISLLGSGLPAGQRMATSFFGIRGMGTVYYLAHAVNGALPGRARDLGGGDHRHRDLGPAARRNGEPRAAARRPGSRLIDPAAAGRAGPPGAGPCWAWSPTGPRTSPTGPPSARSLAPHGDRRGLGHGVDRRRGRRRLEWAWTNEHTRASRCAHRRSHGAPRTRATSRRCWAGGVGDGVVGDRRPRRHPHLHADRRRAHQRRGARACF